MNDLRYNNEKVQSMLKFKLPSCFTNIREQLSVFFYDKYRLHVLNMCIHLFETKNVSLNKYTYWLTRKQKSTSYHNENKINVIVNNCQLETKNNRAQSIYVNTFQECIDEMTLTQSSKSTSNLGSWSNIFFSSHHIMILKSNPICRDIRK